MGCTIFGYATIIITPLVSFSSLYDLLAKLKNRDHVLCPCNLAFRLLSGFFQVPDFLQGGKARNFSKFQRLYSEPEPIYMREVRNFSKSLSSIRKVNLGILQLPEPIGRENSEFFQLSKPIKKGRSRNFSKSQSLYCRRYSFIFSTYFFIFLHIFHIFLHYFFIFSAYFFIIIIPLYFHIFL